MKVKDKEKLNYPLQGWQILSAVSSMVQCVKLFLPKDCLSFLQNWAKFEFLSLSQYEFLSFVGI